MTNGLRSRTVKQARAYVLAVLQDLDLLQGDEPARHDRVENRQKRLDLVLGVDDLDDERQVLGRVDNFRAVDPARMTEAHPAAQDRRACETELPSRVNNRFVERAVVNFRVLADENAEQHGVLW